MRTKKIISVLVLLSIAVCKMITEVSAAGAESLQVYFTEDGSEMNIFLSESLDTETSVLIGNDIFDAEVINDNININTTFLIDNSNSIPEKLRNQIKRAVKDYVSSMSKSEKVKIVKFDKEIEILSDEYSDSVDFIDYELSKIDFDGKESQVYDALMDVVKTMDTDNDTYYRTVLITDGADSVGSTSFEYLRTEISENGRYHIDVVNVNEKKIENANLKAIGSLGSNTFRIFSDGANLSSIAQNNVSLVKVALVNEVTTGELKGVTIKSGSNSISIGSILFPQIEIDSDAQKDAKTTTPKKTTESKNIIIIIVVTLAGVLGIALIIVVIVYKKKKKKAANNDLKCNLAVEVKKDDPRDQAGVGKAIWVISANSEFRVGRILKPTSNGKEILLENHMAICENAVNEDIGSIGRNAFSLKYDINSNSVIIKNIAKNAKFSIVVNGKTSELRGGQTALMNKESQILLGNYTTVIIHNIVKNNK